VKDGGALTPLVYAVRSNDLESVKVLLAAGADTTGDAQEEQGHGHGSSVAQ